MPTSPSHDLYKEILNALPTPVFLVDADMFVLEYNQAAHDSPIAARPLHPRRAARRTCARSPSTRPIAPRVADAPPTAANAVCVARSTTPGRVRGGYRRGPPCASCATASPRTACFIITISPFSGTEGRWLLVMDDRTEQAELEKRPPCSSCREGPHRSDASPECLRRPSWDGDPAACPCPGCQRLLGAEG